MSKLYHYIIMLVATLLSVTAIAQSIERSVIASAGISINNNLQIDYTIGETAVVPLIKENILLTQGFQQPIYFNRPVTNVFPYFIIYPNPTEGDAQVRFVLTKLAVITINIYNAIGQMITKETVRFPAGEMQYLIKSSNFIAGSYIIQFAVNDVSLDISRILLKVN
jgi:hypothetical protein